MSGVLNNELIYEILSAVEEIPEGKVASYGQIARLIGREKNSRLVGKVLSMAEYYGKYPCQRVVNSAGQADLLRVLMSSVHCLKTRAWNLRKTAVWI